MKKEKNGEIQNIEVIDQSADSPLNEADLQQNSSETYKTEENKRILRKLRFQHIVDINMMRIFLFVLIAAMVIALIPGLRPDYSDVEKRELTKFPKPSIKAIASGEFFDQIGLWYSDTFPFREQLVKLNGYITGTYGLADVQIHGDVSAGDDIPDVEEIPAAPSEPEKPVPLEPPKAPEPAVEKLGAMLIVDNAAYEYYNFNNATADLYAAHISRAADMLASKASVYNMIIPTSLAITAPDKIAATVNSSDQKKAIEYMSARMSGNVKKVMCFEPLKSKRDEYIYFRTDHHWTALGAYYAYCELMKAKGIEPAALSAFTECRYDGFLGTFYAESGQKPQLGNTPDTVFAYKPAGLEKIDTIIESGQKRRLSIVSDGNALSASNKYLTFICGDHPFGHINNPQIADNSACIVIKESFGNAMVPFLTQHYRDVYVVDYRYFQKIDGRKLAVLASDTAAADVIFINNISATRNPSLVSAIGAFIG